ARVHGALHRLRRAARPAAPTDGRRAPAPRGVPASAPRLPVPWSGRDRREHFSLSSPPRQLPSEWARPSIGLVSEIPIARRIVGATAVVRKGSPGVVPL